MQGRSIYQILKNSIASVMLSIPVNTEFFSAAVVFVLMVIATIY